MTSPTITVPVTIRPFTPDDYPAVAEVQTAVYPDHPQTPAEMRYQDENRDPRITWGRFLAEREGRVIGTAYFGQESNMYHPQKFFIGVNVLPEHRGRGVGKALYERLREAVAPHNPIALRCDAREDALGSLRFLEARGFAEEMRELESELNVANFQPDDWAGELTRTAEQGIVIRSYTELIADDPEAGHKLHELHWQLMQDIPHPDELTRVPWEVWSKRFTNPHFLPDANFVALDGEEYVGVSVLWKNDGDPKLHTGITGVLRTHRKRGIATALKVRALTYAKEHEAAAVRTFNEVNNNGMLGINFRLGFVPVPAWIFFVKHLTASEG
jgi:mycothiol synthase